MTLSELTPLVLLEWVAVVLNILFAVLIAYEKRIGWAIGFVASVIGVGLYLQAQTWAMSVLNAYYVVMAVYGWWSWGHSKNDRSIRVQSWTFQASMAVAGLVASYIVFFFLRDYLNGRLPGLDAFVTVFSFIATWMMARKYIACWYWFIVADSVSIWLNWQIDYKGFALLNAIYLGTSVFGLMKWGRALRAQRQVQATME